MWVATGGLGWKRNHKASCHDSINIEKQEKKKVLIKFNGSENCYPKIIDYHVLLGGRLPEPVNAFTYRPPLCHFLFIHNLDSSNNNNVA